MIYAYHVVMSAVGNPDFRQAPGPLPDVPRRVKRVASLKEASKVCRDYIRHYDLGSGNWSGGQVYDADTGSAPVAQVSYNGRLWKPGPWSEENELSLCCGAPVHQCKTGDDGCKHCDVCGGGSGPRR